MDTYYCRAVLMKEISNIEYLINYDKNVYIKEKDIFEKKVISRMPYFLVDSIRNPPFNFDIYYTARIITVNIGFDPNTYWYGYKDFLFMCMALPFFRINNEYIYLYYDYFNRYIHDNTQLQIINKRYLISYYGLNLYKNEKREKELNNIKLILSIKISF
ncbi:MAG: hypothetical protein IRZ03_18430 [Acidobacterium ailaaui]|nr:hypothetical protein [Pseudacidobacterium ailaaui]